MIHMDKRKVFILVIAIIALASVTLEAPTLSVVNMDTCYEKEDCRVAVAVGFCDVKYSCEGGKCFSQNIRCPEICNDNKDNDYNGQTDCKDSACATTTQCPCINAQFESCFKGGCYCPSGSPKWIVFLDDSNECRCG